MFESFSLTIAFVGSILASIWDLKTTEIPDEIPYAMIGIGVVAHLTESFLTGNYSPLFFSLVVGLSFLGFGFLMYYSGQWGGGDAKVLSAIGFLLPSYPSEKVLFPFPVSFLFNVFIIGAGYMILYAFILAILQRKILFSFVKDIKASSKLLFLSLVVTMASVILFSLSIYWMFHISILEDILYIASMSALIVLILFFLLKFVKTVEDVGFKKKIPVSELKVGDVLLESKIWDGINEKQLKEIRKSGKKYVWIKEGVRFAPAFPLALLFTLLFGDGIFLLINFIGT
jgi:prepilin signal peptidase PulO-like enzyme (type II secretory pathway)